MSKVMQTSIMEWQMNWIEIDKILYRIIERHTDISDAYTEAQKQFKWDLGQAKSAIDPLVKRHPSINTVCKTPTKKPRKTNSK